MVAAVRGGPWWRPDHRSGPAESVRLTAAAQRRPLRSADIDETPHTHIAARRAVRSSRAVPGRTAGARSRLRALWLALVVAGVVLGGTWSNADRSPTADAAGKQITIWNHTGVHDRDTYWEPKLDQPASYTGSPDYANGTAYLKLQVLSKPSNKLMIPSVCFWRHGAQKRFQFETCARTRDDAFTSTGTYWIELGTPKTWWKKNGVFDWSKPVSVGRIMLKDPATGSLFLSSKCGQACYQGNDLGRHVPLRMASQLVFVAKGATFTPPPGWNDPNAGSTTGGSTSGGSTSGGSTTGGSTTGGSTSGGSTGATTTTTVPLDPVPAEVSAQRAVASRPAERIGAMRDIAPPG